MLFYLAIFLIAISILLCAIHYWIRGGRRGRLVDKIPGPYPWPVIGNIPQFMLPLEGIWRMTRKINTEYYPINRIWGAHVPIISIFHPDDVKALLSSKNQITKGPMYHAFHPWLGTGLLTSTGAKWQLRRKILTPAFHIDVLQQFIEIFIEQSENLVQSLCRDGEEVVPDLALFLNKYTLNSICETAMGTTPDLNDETLNEFRLCVEKMSDILVYRYLRPWTYVDWMFKFFPKYREQVETLKVIHGFSSNIIKKRQQYHEDTNGRYLEGLGDNGSSGSSNFNGDHIGGKRRLAMLDLLISAAKRDGSIDDEGIREEVDTFIFGGHDTSAMTLSFTFLMLAENKECQDKARAEVDAIFEEIKGGTLSMRDIQGLVYLDQCFKESLRLYPTAPFIARQITEDLQLKNYVAPKGSVIHVFFYDLHRDPNFWPNPNAFDPERFSPDQIRNRHPFAFVPFSAGPRNCIGQKYAMMEMKVLIAYFLRNFYFEPIDFSSDLTLIPNVVVGTATPIRLKFIPRLRDD